MQQLICLVCVIQCRYCVEEPLVVRLLCAGKYEDRLRVSVFNGDHTIVMNSEAESTQLHYSIILFF